MEIILGKTAGFCYGVKRAVNGAENELKKGIKYCLGEIVHNKNVINRLEKNGMHFIENIEEANGSCIIRAHGVTKNIYGEASRLNIRLQDLTCPNVVKIHQIAEKYVQDGYFIVLIGKKSHPEVVGTESFCGENSFIVSDFEDIEECKHKLIKSGLNNVLIIGQTTYNSKKFDEIVDGIKLNFKNYNIEVKKTICMATEVRQKETDEISKKVDIMLIIGDEKSSNTNKLADISKLNCKNVYLIQGKEDIINLDFSKVERIGIMAGASTPGEDIENVIKYLKNIGKERCNNTSN